jgi:mycofactocin biosynthetic radical S-adenosylmethionine protein MftC
MDGPDPECVQGHSEQALARDRSTPRPRADHSRTTSKPVPLTLSMRPPARLCNESPV